MANGVRDVNIGTPQGDKAPMSVADSTVVNAINGLEHEIGAVTEELKKIRLGTGLIMGVDLNEGEAE